MSSERTRRPIRAGGRTILTAVAGLGSAAFVTSVSALSVGSDDASVALAVVGGTAVLVAMAIIALLCALRMPGHPDRRAWVLAGISLALTAAGAGLRAGAMLGGGAFVELAAPEMVYMVGSVLLMGALVVWPLPYRSEIPMGTVVVETLVVTAVVAAGLWGLVVRQLPDRASDYGGVGPDRMRQFLLFLLVFAGAALLSAVCAGNLGRARPTMQWAVASFGAALIIAGDLAWLADVADLSWAPGSLGDFAHIAGHVLIATGASLALDYARGEVSRPAE